MRVILLHGWSLEGRVMAPLASALSASGHQVLCPDLPGHGPATSARFSDARGLLDRLTAGPKPVVLVGWSMGALMAWDWLFAAPRPQVAGLVSLDMTPCPLPAPGWPYAMGPEAEPLLSRAHRYRSHWPQVAPAIASGIFGPAAQAQAASLLPVIAAREGALMAGLWGELLLCDLRPAVAQLTLPQLFIHGAQSSVCPPDCAAWLAQTAPDGQGLVLPDVGHAPHLEAPALTAGIIRDFLKTLPRSP